MTTNFTTRTIPSTSYINDRELTTCYLVDINGDYLVDGNGYYLITYVPGTISTSYDTRGNIETSYTTRGDISTSFNTERGLEYLLIEDLGHLLLEDGGRIITDQSLITRYITRTIP